VKNVKHGRKLEKVTINHALPRKAARYDAVAKLKSFWGFESELQTNPMQFHLHLRRVATSMLLVAICDDLAGDRTKY